MLDGDHGRCIGEQDLVAMYEGQGMRCYFTGESLGNVGIGAARLDWSQGWVQGNVVLCREFVLDVITRMRPKTIESDGDSVRIVLERKVARTR